MSHTMKTYVRYYVKKYGVSIREAICFMNNTKTYPFMFSNGVVLYWNGYDWSDNPNN